MRCPNHGDEPEVGTPDALVESRPMRVSRLLGELARLRVPLAVQLPSGRVVGAAWLRAASPVELVLACPDLGGDAEGDELRLAVVAGSGPDGWVMFTAGPLKRDAEGRWRGRWPEFVLRVHRRRHERLVARQDAGHRAQLRLPDGGVRRVRDLTEEGIGFELTGAGEFGAAWLCDATLELEGERPIPLPWLHVVRTDFGSVTGGGQVGGTMPGLPQASRQRLRAWIEQRLAAGRRAAP